MATESITNRRNSERRVDKLTAKARMTVGTLKRTVGMSAAKRFLERNKYTDELVQDMLQNSVERRLIRRRGDIRAGRLYSKRENSDEVDAFGSLTVDEIKLLYRLRAASDTQNVTFRFSDCPPQFSRFGFVQRGPRGAQITERGRSTLLHWTRAQALFAVLCGQGMHGFDESVQSWLLINRFVEIGHDGAVATARGEGWLEGRRKTLIALR